MPLPAIGVLSVACPVCRVSAGRRCRNRRGYFTDLAHDPRRAAWLHEERLAQREAVRASAERHLAGAP